MSARDDETAQIATLATQFAEAELRAEKAEAERDEWKHRAECAEAWEDESTAALRKREAERDEAIAERDEAIAERDEARAAAQTLLAGAQAGEAGTPLHVIEITAFQLAEAKVRRWSEPRGES